VRQRANDFIDQELEKVSKNYSVHKNPVQLAQEMAEAKKKIGNNQEVMDVMEDAKFTETAMANYGQGNGAYGFYKTDPETGQYRKLTYDEFKDQRAKTGHGFSDVYGRAAKAADFEEEVKRFDTQHMQKIVTESGLVENPTTGGWTSTTTGNSYKTMDEAFYNDPYAIANTQTALSQNYDEESTNSALNFKIKGRTREDYIDEASKVLKTRQALDKSKTKQFVSPSSGGGGGGGGNGTEVPVIPINYRISGQEVDIRPFMSSLKDGGASIISEYEDTEKKLANAIQTNKDPGEIAELRDKLATTEARYTAVKSVETAYRKDPEVLQMWDKEKVQLFKDLKFDVSTYQSSENMDYWKSKADAWEVASQKMANDISNVKGISDLEVSKKQKAIKENAINNFIEANGLGNADDLDKLEEISEGYREIDGKIKEQYLTPKLGELAQMDDIRAYQIAPGGPIADGIKKNNREQYQFMLTANDLDFMSKSFEVSKNTPNGIEIVDIDNPLQYQASVTSFISNPENIEDIYLEGWGENLTVVAKLKGVTTSEGITPPNTENKGAITTVRTPVNQAAIQQITDNILPDGSIGANLDTNAGLAKLVANYISYTEASAAEGGLMGNKTWVSDHPQFGQHMVDQYGGNTSSGKGVNVREEVINSNVGKVHGNEFNGEFFKDPFLSFGNEYILGNNGTYSSGKVIYHGQDAKSSQPVTVANVREKGLFDKGIVGADDPIDVTVALATWRNAYAENYRTYLKEQGTSKDLIEQKMGILGSQLDNGDSNSVFTDNPGFADHHFVFPTKTLANKFVFSGKATGGK
jgi:hypothetical protein